MIGQGVKYLLRKERILVARLHNLDIAEDRIIFERYREDERALVLVETAPGVGGVMQLMADTVQERWSEDNKRVTRQSRRIEEAVGVEVCSTYSTDLGEAYLVSMWPGASFRILRSGALEGAPPGLRVSWSGKFGKTWGIEGWGLSVSPVRWNL